MLSQNVQKVKFAEVCLYLISVKTTDMDFVYIKDGKNTRQQNVPALKKFHIHEK